MYQEIRCKNCSKPILSSTECKIIYKDAHNSTTTTETTCPTVTESNSLYLNEDELPSWISERIEQEQWSKGRINCPRCDSRIGGFDFISGLHCACKLVVLPSVHLTKSKVDAIRSKINVQNINAELT